MPQGNQLCHAARAAVVKTNEAFLSWVEGGGFVHHTFDERLGHVVEHLLLRRRRIENPVVRLRGVVDLDRVLRHWGFQVSLCGLLDVFFA